MGCLTILNEHIHAYEFSKCYLANAAAANLQSIPTMIKIQTSKMKYNNPYTVIPVLKNNKNNHLYDQYSNVMTWKYSLIFHHPILSCIADYVFAADKARALSSSFKSIPPPPTPPLPAAPHTEPIRDKLCIILFPRSQSALERAARSAIGYTEQVGGCVREGTRRGVQYMESDCRKKKKDIHRRTHTHITIHTHARTHAFYVCYTKFSVLSSRSPVLSYACSSIYF